MQYSRFCNFTSQAQILGAYTDLFLAFLDLLGQLFH